MAGDGTFRRRASGLARVSRRLIASYGHGFGADGRANATFAPIMSNSVKSVSPHADTAGIGEGAQSI